MNHVFLEIKDAAPETSRKESTGLEPEKRAGGGHRNKICFFSSAHCLNLRGPVIYLTNLQLVLVFVKNKLEQLLVKVKATQTKKKKPLISRYDFQSSLFPLFLIMLNSRLLYLVCQCKAVTQVIQTGSLRRKVIMY